MAKADQEAPRPKGYFSITHTRSYNFVFAGTLLLLYELAIRLFSGESGLKNAVDAWFSMAVAWLNLPLGTLYISLGLLVVAAGVVWYDSRQGIRLRGRYLAVMWAESLIWALLIYFNLALAVHYLPFAGEMLGNQAGGGGGGFMQFLALSLGAGFYEELLFRFLLVKFLLVVAMLLKQDPKHWGTRLTVAVITAFLFSAAHLDIVVGATGEPFKMYNFVYRFLFGLVMSGLVLLRGLGIAAWTHAWYDILVFGFRALLG